MREGSFVTVDGIRTHYLEAGREHRGRSPSLLLLHSAEYGGAAEFSWELNLEALGARHHVLAPDHLGFGLTDKVFDFCGQFNRRIAHIRRYQEVMGTAPVTVVASSMSGGMALTVAARREPDWPMARLVVSSGGGEAPDNAARKILNSYDGTREHMCRILGVMFLDKRWAHDAEYVERRWQMSRLPGAWEATTAARFKAPFGEPGARERDAIDYSAIRIPVLVLAGRHDPLRKPGYWEDFVPLMPNAELHVFERAAHMGQIECAEEFNARVLGFLGE
jgi:pimeloyl-ACP methyl ester carboxylesterase